MPSSAAALGAEAMTPETPAAAAARDGFVTYDELRGPDLDAACWSPARLPLPTGGEHVPLDPNAKLIVGEGEVRVTIPRFSLSHDTFQPADSAKYLIFSTGQFELPPDRPATFAVDLAVKNLGGESADYRRGMAAFQVFDFEVTKRVFSVCGTSTRVFALHEQSGAAPTHQRTAGQDPDQDCRGRHGGASRGHEERLASFTVDDLRMSSAPAHLDQLGRGHRIQTSTLPVERYQARHRGRSKPEWRTPSPTGRHCLMPSVWADRWVMRTPRPSKIRSRPKSSAVPCEPRPLAEARAATRAG
jgi:Family of unknown function (DUF6081)